MTTHTFPISEEFIEEIDSGRMTFLPTVYHRPYQAGDTVILYPYSALTPGKETGSLITREINFVLPGAGLGKQCGVREDYCILGLK